VLGTIFELGLSKTLPDPVRFHSGSTEVRCGSLQHVRITRSAAQPQDRYESRAKRERRWPPRR
jgi:hypothetical protein